MAVPKIKRKDKNDKIRIPVFNILLVFFCSFLLMISTFVQIKIIHPIIPLDIFSNNTLLLKDFLHSHIFIPQVTAVIFVAGLLGRKLGVMSVIIYILLGLFLLPIFALGGGVKYFSEFGFGYILAYLPAVYCAGTFLKEDYSFKNIIKATFVGILIIHVFGILYMLFIDIFRQEGWLFIKGWILYQSGIKLVYDLGTSFVALIIAKYGNKYIKYLNG